MYWLTKDLEMANKIKIKWIANELDWYGNKYTLPTTDLEFDRREFSILEAFTDEELAQELCRRTELGKELE